MMRIRSHARTYQDALAWIKENYPKIFERRNYSIQHVGQGWQAHKWAIIFLPWQH
jgi:hypothetical protein